MLSDEEREALRNFKSEYETCDHYSSDLIIELDDAETILNLIEKQSKEIEELKDKLTEKICKGVEEEILEEYRKEIEHQKEKRENQKKELAILNAKQIEFNKLVNTVNSYKGQFKRQQKELEELKEDSCCMTTCLRRDKEKLFLEDKIKAKIEEIDIEIQCCEYADDDTEEYKQDIEKEKRRLLRDKAVLQSLLEKE